jgi:hypothetical protein
VRERLRCGRLSQEVAPRIADAPRHLIPVPTGTPSQTSQSPSYALLPSFACAAAAIVWIAFASKLSFHLAHPESPIREPSGCAATARNNDADSHFAVDSSAPGSSESGFARETKPEGLKKRLPGTRLGGSTGGTGDDEICHPDAALLQQPADRAWRPGEDVGICPRRRGQRRNLVLQNRPLAEDLRPQTLRAGEIEHRPSDLAALPVQVLSTMRTAQCRSEVN